MTRPNIRLNELDFHLLGRSAAQHALMRSAYELWRDGWSVTLRELAGIERVDSDEFTVITRDARGATRERSAPELETEVPLKLAAIALRSVGSSPSSAARARWLARLCSKAARRASYFGSASRSEPWTGRDRIRAARPSTS